MLVGEWFVQLGVAALVEVAVVETEGERLEGHLGVQGQLEDECCYVSPVNKKNRSIRWYPQY